MPSPEVESAPSAWRNWFGLLQSYLPPDEQFVCPRLDIKAARDRTHGYEVTASYALNGRFFGTFGPGPFPFEHLELPAQTAILVAAGTFQEAPPPHFTPLSRVHSHLYTSLLHSPHSLHP